MGVDYTPNYGIGYQIDIIQLRSIVARMVTDSDDIEEYDISELMDCLPDNDNFKFSWFETGQSNYTGGENDIFIIINKPFSDGVDKLQEKADKLENFINKLGFTDYGEIDLVGGLLVW